ncbi:hypothetical protein E2986_12901 [Frieseomelitta varia]|uniref:Ig-like domain-containing protein n=1 Tax=Frieseomelitta varia TaxID=561572 RepID=A0A833SGZ8_9HYME|nr:hypothetical protein E2986_12901 [Frieseomelitta varia]
MHSPEPTAPERRGTASKSNLIVDIEPKRQTAVRLGESLQILCRVGRPLRVCRVEIPGEEGGMVLSKGQPPEDGIEYYGEGTEAGQCGVRIAKIKESHDGVFKCTLTTTDSRAEAQASMTIIVATILTKIRSPFLRGERTTNALKTGFSEPPNNPELQTSPGSDGRNIYRKGEKLEPTIERFGYVIGRQGVVNVTVYANPRPRFLWRVNNEVINEGRPDESNRLETSTATDLGRGAWSVILTIDSVQKSDTEKDYVLEARNGEGAYEYRIILSTATEPAGVDLDAGSIIGIVVGALVLLLIVFILIFARATGRWCFAARRRGDEEAASGVGAGSEAHITPGDEDEEDHEDPRIIDEKIPQGGQENPIHASTEYVNGRTDIKEPKKDEKTDTPV